MIFLTLDVLEILEFDSEKLEFLIREKLVKKLTNLKNNWQNFK